MGHVIIVKRYTINQIKAAKAYESDVDEMANRGYVPISQSWSPEEWTGGISLSLFFCASS
jgi:hypothetical protein